MEQKPGIPQILHRDKVIDLDLHQVDLIFIDQYYRVKNCQ